MTENLDKEVSEMCNIGEGYYEKGLEKGVAQGIAQGVTQANIETARNLIKLGSLTIAQIAQSTNLSEDTVRELATA